PLVDTKRSRTLQCQTRATKAEVQRSPFRPLQNHIAVYIATWRISPSTTTAYFRRDYDATGLAAFSFFKALSVLVHDRAGGNAVKSCDGSKIARRIHIIRLILYCESQRRTGILSEGDGMCTPCKSKKRQDA